MKNISEIYSEPRTEKHKKEVLSVTRVLLEENRKNSSEGFFSFFKDLITRGQFFKLAGAGVAFAFAGIIFSKWSNEKNAPPGSSEMQEAELLAEMEASSVTVSSIEKFAVVEKLDLLENMEVLKKWKV